VKVLLKVLNHSFPLLSTYFLYIDTRLPLSKVLFLAGFPCVTPFDCHDNLVMWVRYSHFIGKKTEPQKDNRLAPGDLARKIQSLDLTPESV